MCYILYVATHTEVAVPAAIVEMNTGVAVSTVVGTIIVLVATLPDFGSFVHNRKHALIAAGVTFLVATLLYWRVQRRAPLVVRDLYWVRWRYSVRFCLRRCC